MLAAWLVASWLIIAVVHGGCNFPKEWSGKWFQSGVRHLISINSSFIETKGECLENDGEKFIIEDKSDSCFRCVVIHENHPNVLQYKETYCDNRDSIANLCGQIPGDATLFSMFRTEGGPEPCPFKGPSFTFTYNRGTGECSSPVSRVDSCTDESRLLLRYQACPDVHGTESTVEELVCLASWKDGSVRYLVGKLYHTVATSDEQRYRCFVYEHNQSDDKVTYTVAQSGDATCTGLTVTEGSRTMKLTRVDSMQSVCRFPSWISDHRRWHTLDYKRSFHVSHRNSSLRITADGESESRVVCHSMERSAPHTVTLVTHATSACNSGFVCMVFYRREGHVIELQQSTQIVQVAEEACSAANFHSATLPYTTLITASLHPRKCPYLGRYTVSGLSIDGQQVVRRRRRKREDGPEGEVCSSEDFESLVVGCSDSSDTMQFKSPCDTSAYSCHGSWEDNGTSYLIASPLSRKSVGARRYCFIYTQSGDSPGGEQGSQGKGKRAPTLQLSSVTESCHRNISPGITGAWAFNLTINGQCAEASTGAVSATVIVLPSVFFILTLTAALANLR